MMFHPRLTIRALLDRETDNTAWSLWVTFTILVAVIALILGMLPSILWEKPPLSIKDLFLGILILATINIIMFYYSSYVYWKTSLWLGGQCDKSQMRIAFAWSVVIPFVVSGAISIIFSFLLGTKSTLVLLTNDIWTLWSIVISVACIRETANLSIWRAMIVLISPFALVAAVLLSLIASFGLLYWVCR